MTTSIFKKIIIINNSDQVESWWLGSEDSASKTDHSVQSNEPLKKELIV